MHAPCRRGLTQEGCRLSLLPQHTGPTTRVELFPILRGSSRSLRPWTLCTPAPCSQTGEHHWGDTHPPTTMGYFRDSFLNGLTISKALSKPISYLLFMIL